MQAEVDASYEIQMEGEVGEVAYDDVTAVEVEAVEADALKDNGEVVSTGVWQQSLFTICHSFSVDTCSSLSDYEQCKAPGIVHFLKYCINFASYYAIDLVLAGKSISRGRTQQRGLDPGQKQISHIIRNTINTGTVFKKMNNTWRFTWRMI